MPRANPMTMKRINRELADLSKEDLGGMALAPNDANLFEWKATIPGPAGSVYEGGLFQVDITLPEDYPFSAPKATFVTRIYHMNISERGQVCVDLLKHNWSPALSLFKVLLSLSSLLTDPNPKDPLVPTIATQYNRQRALHDATARQWVQLYAHHTPAQNPNPTPASSSAPVQRPSRRSRSTATTTQQPPHSVPTTINGTGSSNGIHHPRTRTETQRRIASGSATPITISDDEETPSSRKRKAVPTSTDETTGQRRPKKRVNGGNSSGSAIVIDD